LIICIKIDYIGNPVNVPFIQSRGGTMSDTIAHAMLADILSALDLTDGAASRVNFTGRDRLPSCFPVSELAVASIGAAAVAVSELVGLVSAKPPVCVDYRAASLWFGWSIRPQGWDMPAPWDSMAGDYEARDGWIKLHTNAPHHRVALLSVLGCEPTRDAVALSVATWGGNELEDAIIAAGGCAARLRSAAEWAGHPQGKAVAEEALVIWDTPVAAMAGQWLPSPARPLSGLRVLDLTRVLAGPVATRFLAGFGADVLRIDPPGWDEPGVIPEVTLGKHCARLDLKTGAILLRSCSARPTWSFTGIAAMHSKRWDLVPVPGRPFVRVLSIYRSMLMDIAAHGCSGVVLIVSFSFHRGSRLMEWHGAMLKRLFRFPFRHSIMRPAISSLPRQFGA
jgi:CoA-transferase family III